MTHLKFYSKGVLLLFSSTILYGCPPINYKFYVRNTTSETACISLKLDSNYVAKNKKKVRFKNNFAEINNNTLSKLNDLLPVEYNNQIATLCIPIKSTVFLNDLLTTSNFLIPNEYLKINSSMGKDSFLLHYPYRKNIRIKHKRESPYNLFYRTIIYYDIK